MWYVYILRCSDGTHYTGSTNNVEDRLKRHMNGDVHYTKSRLPVVLVVYIAFCDKYKAYQYEKYLKSGSGRAFSKKALVVKEVF